VLEGGTFPRRKQKQNGGRYASKIPTIDQRRGETGEQNRPGAGTPPLAVGMSAQWSAQNRLRARSPPRHHLLSSAQPWPSTRAPGDLDAGKQGAKRNSTRNSTTSALRPFPPTQQQPPLRQRRSSEPGQQQQGATTTGAPPQLPPRRVVKVINFVAITVGDKENDRRSLSACRPAVAAAKAPPERPQRIDFPQKRTYSTATAAVFQKPLKEREVVPSADPAPTTKEIESVQMKDNMETIQRLQVKICSNMLADILSHIQYFITRSFISGLGGPER
jgi:hypothetical protein